MKRLLPFVALLALSTPCRADDWPQWRGPDATGIVPKGVRVPTTLPTEPEVVWRAPIGDGWAPLVVAKGVLYYLDAQEGKEVVHAVDAATGQERWRHPLDVLFSDSGSVPGPRTAPLVDGDRVYVQSCYGEFRCLSVADGKVLWRTRFSEDFGAMRPAEVGDNPGGIRHGYSSPPAVDGDRLIVAVGSEKGASLVCFDKRDGKVLWKSQNDPPGHLGPIVTTVAGVKQVAAFTAIACIGVDIKTGALLWRLPIETRNGRHAMTPIVSGGMVVVGSIDTGLTGIRVTRKGAGLTAEKAWNLPSLGVNFYSPVALGPMVYALGPGDSLNCVDARTGAIVWKKDRFFAGLVHSEYIAPMGMAGNLLILTDGGQLLLLRPDGKDCRELGRATVCGRNWAGPAYANGCLYLRDARELKCVRLVK